MNEMFAPWIRMQQQLIESHKNNVETVLKQMSDSGMDAPAKAAREMADQQIQAWEKMLTLFGGGKG